MRKFANLESGPRGELTYPQILLVPRTRVFRWVSRCHADPRNSTDANTGYFTGKLGLGRLSGLVLLLALSSPIASLCSPTAVTDSSQPKNVLVLYPFNDTHLLAPFDALKLAVHARVSVPVNFFVEYMEADRLEDPEYEKSFSQSLQAVYRKQHLDAVIVSTTPALYFALNHRDQLFPGVPIVFNHLPDRRLPNQVSWPGVTGVTMSLDIHGSVDLVFRLQPDIQNLAIVTGSSQVEKYWLDAFRKEVSSRKEKVSLIDLSGLSPSESLQRISQIPPHTAVFFQVLPNLSAQPMLGIYELMAKIGSQIPTYCVMQNYCIGRGGIGGSLPDFDEQNAQTAALVARIFAGEKPDNIPIVHDSGARPVVDARQLKRWRISESQLPSGSVVLFRPSTVWQDHKDLILGTLAVIALQLFFILRLLYEGARKRRTLAALKESEERFRVMADSAPTLIWMAEADANITYVNQRTLDFTGAKPEALYNNGWRSFVHPDDLPRVLEANSTVLDRQKGFSKEFRLRRHDGVYRWMFDISAPRFRENGSFVGFIGSVIDVTDQRSATEALEKLGGRLIEAQEKERSLIARELHDDICQRLAMLAVKIERTMDNQDMASGLRHQAMKDAWKQCSNLAGDVQALSHELHSSILDHLGLVAAADNFCQEFAKLHQVRVEFVQQNVADSLPRDVPLSLFRVLQEALRNALKHSGVNRFYVCLRGTPAEVTLEIWDQGVGFDLQKAKANGGIGLISVEERVNLLGGSLMIESGVGLGTKIRVSIPLVESGATAEKRVAASQG